MTTVTNEVKINLSKADIAKAIDDYIAKKYPTFTSKSIYIGYIREEMYGYAKGTIKES